MSKHSPEPWTALFSTYRKPLVVSGSASVAVVADADFQKPDEVIANAHLIAAAPDMLAALELARNFCSDIGQTLRNQSYPLDEICAAIAKAKNHPTEDISSVIAKAKGEDA